MDRLEELIINNLLGLTRSDAIGKWKDNGVIYSDKNIEYTIVVNDDEALWVEVFIKFTCKLLGQESMFLQIGSTNVRLISEHSAFNGETAQPGSTKQYNKREFSKYLRDTVMELYTMYTTLERSLKS